MLRVYKKVFKILFENYLIIMAEIRSVVSFSFNFYKRVWTREMFRLFADIIKLMFRRFATFLRNKVFFFESTTIRLIIFFFDGVLSNVVGVRRRKPLNR